MSAAGSDNTKSVSAVSAPHDRRFLITDQRKFSLIITIRGLADHHGLIFKQTGWGGSPGSQGLDLTQQLSLTHVTLQHLQQGGAHL